MHRNQLIERARLAIEHDSLPRWQMTGIVLVTGLAGFLAAWGLRATGVEAMALRWPLAAVLAYGVFLLQLRLWLATREPVDPGDALPDLSSGTTTSGPGSGGWSSGGGRSGGGGATSRWDGAGGDAGTLAEGIADEGALPLFAAAALALFAAGALVATVWVVWSAPVLMAELVVDAAIAGGLYRRLRRLEAEGWWRVALRRTLGPFLLVVVGAAVAGGVLQAMAPQARTLGEALALRGAAS